MKNLKFGVAGVFTVILGLSSCIEHEVIPAPEPTVDLFCHFQGTINGTNVELTQNVLGYAIENTKAKILLPPPSLSSAVYFSEILSSQTSVAIKVGLGSVTWDASTSNEPTLALFNAFHMNTLTPTYSTSGNSGFEVSYRDGLGKTWVSRQNSVNAQTVTFSNILQESDASGDYSKFDCDFACYVYRIDPVTLLEDSVRIQAAKFKGWFKR